MIIHLPSQAQPLLPSQKQVGLQGRALDSELHLLH